MYLFGSLIQKVVCDTPIFELVGPTIITLISRDIA